MVLLNFQPWGGDVDLLNPNSKIQDWDFEPKLWVARRTIVLRLDVLHDGVRNPLHLLHGDLVLFLITLFLDFHDSLFN